MTNRDAIAWQHDVLDDGVIADRDVRRALAQLVGDLLEAEQVHAA